MVGEVYLLRALIVESKREKFGILKALGIDADALSLAIVANPESPISKADRVTVDAPSALPLGDRSSESAFPTFRSELWWLPNEPALGLVLIREGSFWMGSDRTRDRWANFEEEPEHEIYLPSFYISRYPITVAQFNAFIDDGAYGLRGSPSDTSPPNHPAPLGIDVVGLEHVLAPKAVFALNETEDAQGVDIVAKRQPEGLHNLPCGLDMGPGGFPGEEISEQDPTAVIIDGGDQGPLLFGIGRPEVG